MDRVFVLDFGSQYTQLIARKIRELGVFSEIFPFNLPVSKIKKEKPGAIILSGGPQSVYTAESPTIAEEIFHLGIPILGICYGLQIMTHVLGGKVKSSKKREYGFANLVIKDRIGLLAGIKDREQVWMSHGDMVYDVPPGFRISGSTSNCHAAVIESQKEKIFGVQFHPEVIHTRQGLRILANFLFRQAGMKKEWKMDSFIQAKIQEIRDLVGDEQVICGLSGGVDSLVTSLIIQRAIKDRLTCIFVDNGLLRKGQFRELLNSFRHQFSLNVIGVDASTSFLKKLERVVSPERKRKVIGKEFIRIFEQEAKKIGNVAFLAQGTIYPDVIESNPVKGPSSKIKST